MTISTAISTSSEWSRSVQTEIGTEIEAGVIFEEAKLSVSVTVALAHTWSSATTQSMSVEVTCDEYEDGTKFEGGCMWQWHMEFENGEASTNGVTWQAPYVACTRHEEPQCAPFQKEVNGVCQDVSVLERLLI